MLHNVAILKFEDYRQELMIIKRQSGGEPDCPKRGKK
jgi:hypothetical protein